MICTLSRYSRTLLVGRSLPSWTLSAQFSSSPAEPQVDEQYQREIQEYVKSHWDDTVSRNDWLVQRLKRKLAAGDRASLAEAITLVESRHPTKKAQAEYLLAEILTSAKKKFDQRGVGGLTFRIGLTGSPGVGKSSFIEVFGKYLIEQQQKKVAVLTVDPSSQTTGGSIMGDIARMPELSRDPNAYLRSSATRGTLGGVAKGTNEAVLLCEGAGYDWVLLETVGVGQSEGAVASIVDMVLVLISPAHGDELQGIKRGLMELADLVVVTKSDGELVHSARITQAEFIGAMKLQRPRWPGVWRPKVLRTSARTKEGIADVFTAADAFRKALGNSGDLLKQRHKQMLAWMWQHVDHEIMHLFQRHPQILKRLPDVEEDIRQGRTTAGLAAERLLREFLGV